MRKLLLCLAVVGTCLAIDSSSKVATAASHPCIDCGGCCACVRHYPGGPCGWQCC